MKSRLISNWLRAKMWTNWHCLFVSTSEYVFYLHSLLAVPYLTTHFAFSLRVLRQEYSMKCKSLRILDALSYQQKPRPREVLTHWWEEETTSTLMWNLLLIIWWLLISQEQVVLEVFLFLFATNFAKKKWEKLFSFIHYHLYTNWHKRAIFLHLELISNNDMRLKINKQVNKWIINKIISINCRKW